ncbi:hypothetical protein Ciccas_008588 [Cichlidogyrus casuarinus]|uniref:BPTI/Kunitz inhibitor domain-containing protein n=1 Tax=Cichlidogyrus casuarinus TaxID=1844966 RepID=A0ABD2PZH8_9PLAT
MGDSQSKKSCDSYIWTNKWRYRENANCVMPTLRVQWRQFPDSSSAQSCATDPRSYQKELVFPHEMDYMCTSDDKLEDLSKICYMPHPTSNLNCEEASGTEVEKRYSFNPNSSTCEIVDYRPLCHVAALEMASIPSATSSNIFKTFAACARTCWGLENHTSYYLAPVRDQMQTKKDICSLKPDKGVPLGSKPGKTRWFFNSKECQQLEYRGSRGNANNFESREECLELAFPLTNFKPFL